MIKIKLLLIISFGLLMTEAVNAQTHMRTYDDATTGIAGFSYDISISYKLIKGWTKARPSEVYSVKLVHVVPSSRGFFYKDSKKQFYSCAELGSSCTPNNWRQVIIDLTGRCKSASKDRISFTRINEEKTIEHWIEENGSCSFDGLEANVIQESGALIKIIRDKEQGKTTGSSGSTGSSNSSSTSSPGNSETKKTETNTTAGQIPDSYKGNPLTYNKSIPSASTDKFTQNVEAIGELANAVAPLLEQWSNNIQKRRDAEQKKQEIQDEITKRKKDNNNLYFKSMFLDKYLTDAENGDEKSRMILVCEIRSNQYYNWSILPRRIWTREAADNKNFDAMNLIGFSALLLGKKNPDPNYGFTLQEGIKMLEEAANLGSVDAMVQLGGFYNYNAKGYGGKNAEKAFYWYSKAAENGSPIAMYFVGMIYRYNILDKNYGVKYKVAKNDSLAFNLFLKSVANPIYAESLFQKSQTGNDRLFGGSRFEINSYYELGVMYEKGIGCEINTEIANKLYKEYKMGKSSEKSFSDAYEIK